MVICCLYRAAIELHQRNVHVVSTDEKTGIQALERAQPSRPMRPGYAQRDEYEYIRHGTLSLIASMEVATGRIVHQTIRATRGEQDFLDHVRQTVETASEDAWIFVVDQLNTHMSASLVEYVADACDLDVELGQKGRRGVLESMETRKAFLENRDHRIRFVYTPKNCSWLNQIELWFSVLVRRLLKRASFDSTADLEARLLEFIEMFNRLFAKPYKWTYRGKLLSA